jgi:probable rRNA maturation factor
MNPLTLDLSLDEPRWHHALPEAYEISVFALELAWQRVLREKNTPAFTTEISLYLTSDTGITKLNREYRHKATATNVLSFGMLDAWGDAVIMATQVDSVPLGDIVIAYETVVREAAEQGKSLRDHYMHLLVHGLLHLCGYDHEVEEEAVVMESLEADILQALGVPNPYV